MRIGYLKIEIRPWISSDRNDKELRVTVEFNGKEHHYSTVIDEDDLISNFEMYLGIAKREILKLIRPAYVPDVEDWGLDEDQDSGGEDDS